MRTSRPRSIFRIAICAAILTTIGISGASARTPYTRGEKSFGPRIGFAARNTSASAGLVFEYSFSRHVRIAPQAGIIFRHKDLDALAIDVDVHFPIPFSGDRLAFYPLAGINFTSWSRHGISPDTNKDVSAHLNRFGGNAGVGLEMKCTTTLKLNVEAKSTVMKTYPGAQVSAGIAYVF